MLVDLALRFDENGLMRNLDAAAFYLPTRVRWKRGSRSPPRSCAQLPESTNRQGHTPNRKSPALRACDCNECCLVKSFSDLKSRGPGRVHASSSLAPGTKIDNLAP